VYRKSGRHLGNLYGWGSGPIWLDGVQCIGNESSIAECKHKDWGVHNCGHHMDVSVICDTGKCWEQSSSEHWTGEGTISHRALCNFWKFFYSRKFSVYFWLNWWMAGDWLLSRSNATVSSLRLVSTRLLVHC